MVEEKWLSKANCKDADTELFFPEGGMYAPTEALKICANCDVQQECLKWAVETENFWGVFGGTSQRTRVKLAVSKDFDLWKPVECPECREKFMPKIPGQNFCRWEHKQLWKRKNKAA